MTSTPADHELRYRQLAQQLADIGYITAGSVALRYNRCGKPACGCHADPPRLHGPYGGPRGGARCREPP